MRETARKRWADGREGERSANKGPVVTTGKRHDLVRIAVAAAVLDDEASWHFIARNY